MGLEHGMDVAYGYTVLNEFELNEYCARYLQVYRARVRHKHGTHAKFGRAWKMECDVALIRVVTGARKHALKVHGRCMDKTGKCSYCLPCKCWAGRYL